MAYLGIGRNEFGRRWNAEDRNEFLKTYDTHSATPSVRQGGVPPPAGGGNTYAKNLKAMRAEVDKASVSLKHGPEFSSGQEYRLCAHRHVRMFRDPSSKSPMGPRTTSQDIGWKVSQGNTECVGPKGDAAARTSPGGPSWDHPRKCCNETAYTQALLRSKVDKPNQWFQTGSEANADFFEATPYILRQK